jgi:hypothetical protein
MDLRLEVNDMSSVEMAMGKDSAGKEPVEEVVPLAKESLRSDRSSMGRELEVLGATASPSEV